MNKMLWNEWLARVLRMRESVSCDELWKEAKTPARYDKMQEILKKAGWGYSISTDSFVKPPKL